MIDFSCSFSKPFNKNMKQLDVRISTIKTRIIFCVVSSIGVKTEIPIMNGMDKRIIGITTLDKNLTIGNLHCLFARITITTRFIISKIIILIKTVEYPHPTFKRKYEVGKGRARIIPSNIW